MEDSYDSKRQEIEANRGRIAELNSRLEWLSSHKNRLRRHIRHLSSQQMRLRTNLDGIENGNGMVER